MAKLNKQILGRVSGALGDVVFREKNGQNFIALKPKSFMPGNDENSIARRAKFGLTIKIAQAINADPVLKNAWSLKMPAGFTSYNYIVQQNYPAVQPDDVTALLKLFPESGFMITHISHTFTAASLNIQIGTIGTDKGIDAAVEVNCSLSNILFLNNPVDNTVPENTVLLLNSGSIPLVLDQNLEFTMAVPHQLTMVWDKYQNQKLFSALQTLDAGGKHINNSITVMIN